MNKPLDRKSALSKLQTALSLPVLLAFVIGSLPVLLPVCLYRRFGVLPRH